VATLVMLLGSLLGFALRTTLDPIGAGRWRPMVVSVAGGFALGALTGAALLGLPQDSPLATAGIGLSAAVTTFCVFGAATKALFHEVLARTTVLPALTHVVTGFAAATGGVVLGVTLVS
jgi:fluoride ion exporter CrcB/FEX